MNKILFSYFQSLIFTRHMPMKFIDITVKDEKQREYEKVEKINEQINALSPDETKAFMVSMSAYLGAVIMWKLLIKE